MTSNQKQSQLLFRQEVLDAQRTKLAGGIIITPRISWFFLSLLSVGLAAMVLGYLYWGSYTRRATVSGQILPTAGLIRVTTPQTGVVLEKWVSEGQRVSKGQALFVLSSDRFGSTPNSPELQTQISTQISQRKRSQQDEIARNRSAENQERAQLLRRLDTLKNENLTISRLLEQQRQRVNLAEDARKRYQGLADKDYIPKEQLTQKELDLSEATSRLQNLQRDAIVNEREQAATSREIETVRSRYASQNALLERGIVSSDQELTEVELRRRVVISSPADGTATLPTVEPGQFAETGKSLVNLLPIAEQGQKSLQAKLYAPSRSIGFVKTGSKALLRMQAFPYQKFGWISGKVIAISNTPASNSELAGFSLPELSPGEPVYAITVDLDQQSINTYGEQRPLLAGMRLEADILQESRRLWEWVLEPVFSMKGRMTQ